MVDAPCTGAAEEYAPEVREPAGYRQSDASLKDQIVRQFATDEAIDACGITVEVQDGQVTLSGRVRCYGDMQRAEENICAIEGVKMVRNGLTSVEPPRHAVDSGQPAGAASKMGKPGYER